MSKVENFASNILTSATAPMDDGFRIDHRIKKVYVTYGKPKVIIDEHIVLGDSTPTTGLYAQVPKKVHEFDFWNEYEGFLEANHLKAIPIDDYADEKLYYSYVVDLENMIVYEYESHEVGCLKYFEMNYKTRTLETKVRK